MKGWRRQKGSEKVAVIQIQPIDGERVFTIHWVEAVNLVARAPLSMILSRITSLPARILKPNPFRHKHEHILPHIV